jgi:hypothetical protein
MNFSKFKVYSYYHRYQCQHLRIYGLSLVWTSRALIVALPLDNRIQLAAERSPVEWPLGVFSIELCKQ